MTTTTPPAVCPASTSSDPSATPRRGWSYGELLVAGIFAVLCVSVVTLIALTVTDV